MFGSGMGGGIRFFAGIALVALLALPLVPVQAQEKVTVEIVTNSWHEAVIDGIAASARRFVENNPNIEVTVRRRAGSWDDFMVQVVGGSAPNIVTTSTGLVGQFAHNNIIIPLDDLIARTNLRQEVFGPAWESLTYQGRIYAVPGVEQGPRYGQVWNKRLLDEAGLFVNLDQTMDWEEFLEFAHKLTRFDSNGNVTRVGFDPRNGQNTRSFTIGPLLGTWWVDLETGMPTLNSEGYVNGLSLILDKVYRRYTGWVGSTDWYAIAAETVATSNLGIYGPGEIENRIEGMELIVSWPPHVERKRMQQVSGWGFSIPTGATNVEESMRLIEFLATDVQFQMELYMNVGFMGAGTQFLSELPNAITDPARLWYVTSMARADVIMADRPHPYTSRAVALFDEARNRAFLQEATVRQALDDANNALLNEMRDAGYLK